MLITVSPIGPDGRIKSGGYVVDTRLVEAEVTDVSDDGYCLILRYVSGVSERCYLEGDLPRCLKVVDPI